MKQTIVLLAILFTSIFRATANANDTIVEYKREGFVIKQITTVKEPIKQIYSVYPNGHTTLIKRWMLTSTDSTVATVSGDTALLTPEALREVLSKGSTTAELSGDVLPNPWYSWFGFKRQIIHYQFSSKSSLITSSQMLVSDLLLTTVLSIAFLIGWLFFWAYLNFDEGLAIAFGICCLGATGMLTLFVAHADIRALWPILAGAIIFGLYYFLIFLPRDVQHPDI